MEGYRHGDQSKTMTLSADEVSGVSWCMCDRMDSNAFANTASWETAMTGKWSSGAVSSVMPAPADPTDTSAKDYRDHDEALTGHSVHQCPQCSLGRMLVVMILPRSLGKSAPPPTDSS